MRNETSDSVLKMKTTLSCLLGFGLVLLFGDGCSSPQSVSRLEGNGTKEIYSAGYDQVWKAAVAAAQTGDLYILNAQKQQGYISARRGLQPQTFGENVGIWVRVIGPKQTEVEVVSRQAGPPVLALRNWEKRILSTISADLTT